MAFILVDFVIDHSAALLDSVHHLLGFGFGTARVMSAGKKQKRRLDLVHEVNRRAILISRFVLFQITHRGQIPLLQHGIFVLNFGEPVHERHDGHARRPQFRCFGHAHHGHVPAVAAAHENEFLGIDVTRLLDPVCGSEHVL